MNARSHINTHTQKKKKKKKDVEEKEESGKKCWIKMAMKLIMVMYTNDT